MQLVYVAQVRNDSPTIPVCALLATPSVWQTLTTVKL